MIITIYMSEENRYNKVKVILGALTCMCKDKIKNFSEMKVGVTLIST